MRDLGNLDKAGMVSNAKAAQASGSVNGDSNGLHWAVLAYTVSGALP